MTPTPDALVRQWFREVWDEGREETIDRLLSPDAVVHGLSGPGGPDMIGPEQFKPVFHTFREALGDLTIDVEATAFRAIAMTHEGDGQDRRIGFELDSGDAVILGPEHPLRMIEQTPRVLVRNGLEALVVRPLYYELAEIALAEGHEPPGVWSDGSFFPLQ